MARALEQGRDAADAVSRGKPALDAVDEAKRAAERERWRGLFAPTDDAKPSCSAARGRGSRRPGGSSSRR